MLTLLTYSSFGRRRHLACSQQFAARHRWAPEC
jgi:hypothetical protein